MVTTIALLPASLDSVTRCHHIHAVTEGLQLREAKLCPRPHNGGWLPALASALLTDMQATSRLSAAEPASCPPLKLLSLEGSRKVCF